MPKIYMPERWNDLPENLFDQSGNIYSTAALKQQCIEQMEKIKVLEEIIDKLIKENHVAVNHIKDYFSYN